MREQNGGGATSVVDTGIMTVCEASVVGRRAHLQVCGDAGYLGVELDLWPEGGEQLAPIPHDTSPSQTAAATALAAARRFPSSSSQNKRGCASTTSTLEPTNFSGRCLGRPWHGRGGVVLLCPHQLPVQPQVATICTKENKQGGQSHREASASTSDAASPHGLPTL